MVTGVKYFSQTATAHQQTTFSLSILSQRDLLGLSAGATSAQLRRQKVDPLSVQKANEIVHRVLHSKPVTPVRVDRLDFLLHGYDRVLKQFLVDGFVLVFVFSLLVSGFRLNLLILKALWISQW